MWFFDSALGVLIWYQLESKRASFWAQAVWEPLGFKFGRPSGLPPAPPAIHAILEKARKDGEI